MQQPYQLIVDVWEADVKLDESVLYANGVRGLIIRMNDTLQNDNYDLNFLSQWKQSSMFYRMPYWVWGDWLTCEFQYNKIMAMLPPEAKAIALDVEVDANTPKPDQVQRDLYALISSLQNKGLKVYIYSGSWWWQPAHISQAPWMANVNYWWARYPALVQPDSHHTVTTWAYLKTLFNQLAWAPYNPYGTCKLWQCCSRWSPEGSGGLNIDISLLPGDEVALKTYFGGIEAVPPVPPSPFPGLYAVYVLATATPHLNVRQNPDTKLPEIGELAPGSGPYTIYELSTQPDGLWGRIETPYTGWIRLDFTRKA